MLLQQGWNVMMVRIVHHLAVSQGRVDCVAALLAATSLTVKYGGIRASNV